MFKSATLKLTAWYLAILMAISITFSIVIYQLNYSEMSLRLENLQHSILQEVEPNLFGKFIFILEQGPDSPLVTESKKASNRMLLSLVQINTGVFVAGGLGAYFLARRTLRPIEEAHEAQSRFTSDASHELRTPLAAMKAELEVNLRDPDLKISEARELLESNLEEVNKLIKLSEMLLQLARFDDHNLEFSQVDLVLTLKQTMKRYPDNKKRFIITGRKKLTTRANEPAIAELMGILIDNALKYSPTGSKITIRMFERRGLAGFEIKNNSEPIPKEKLDRIFDRFFRADTSRTNGSKNGYGLGLSIAKKIIDLHHGEITVINSDNDTAFIFYIPLVKGSTIKPAAS